MANVSVAVEHHFLPEFERLRRLGFHDETGTMSSSDAFDAYSLHVVARDGSRPVGLLRITPQPPSILRQWAVDPLPLPSGPDIVEFTRAVVDPEFRGQSVFKTLMLVAVATAANLPGAMTGTAVVEPHSPLFSFLQKLGFSTVGSVIRILDPPCEQPIPCVCLVCNLKDAKAKSELLLKSVRGAMSDAKKFV